jgi:hypothetical protein
MTGKGYYSKALIQHVRIHIGAIAKIEQIQWAADFTLILEKAVEAVHLMNWPMQFHM